MQKKLIALAVAGLASAGAFAQSNVTVYGVADMYIGSFKTDGMERSTQVNSGGLAGSRIGFKGVEDLGNGLKALFVLEYALNLDQNEGVGAGNLADWTVGGKAPSYTSNQARQQMVGLTGNFGTVAAGRLQTAGYDWAVKYDVLAGTAISALQAVNSNFVLGATAVGARANNAIAYISPNFAGLTFAYNRGYVAEESGNKGAENAVYADLIGLNYGYGDFSIGGVWSRVKAEAAAFGGYFGGEAKVTDYSLGASYDFKVVKLGATWQRSKAEGAQSNKAWSLGVAAPVGAAGTVLASYAKSDINGPTLGGFVTDIYTGTYTDTSDRKAYTLAYTHGLSKRTTAYAGYTRTDIKAAAAADADAFVVGVNHKF